MDLALVSYFCYVLRLRDGVGAGLSILMPPSCGRARSRGSRLETPRPKGRGTRPEEAEAALLRQVESSFAEFSRNGSL